jgi:uncharacterized protein YggE
MSHPVVRRSLMLAGLAALLSPATAMAQAAPALVASMPPSLVTSGQGESKITPDRAAVMINVQTRATTASVSAADNATRTQAVLAALEKLGLPRAQLSTEGYSVYPEMAYDKNGANPRVAAYVVTNTVRAETHQPAQAGAMVDAALGAGANLINGLSFYSASIDAPRREAIGIAVANARADAEAMARAAGGSLGNLIELSTQGPTIPPRPMFEMAMRKGATSEVTPINPGQQTVTVFVNARWQFVAGPR